MGRLDGKVAIITGSGKGLGKAYAEVFAREGAAVTVLCRTEADGLAVVKGITDEGGKAIFVKADVTKRKDVKNVVNKTIEAFGKIDILVNNAHMSPMLPVEEITDEQFEDVWRLGAVGTLYCMQECFPYMKEKGGSIINTTSGSLSVGNPGHGSYASAKGAICGLSFVAANEWGKYGIRVNLVAPMAKTKLMEEWFEACGGKIPEAMQKNLDASALHRIGDAYKDVAPVVLFLASDDSHYISGHIMHADCTPVPFAL